jgi:UDP-glucose 4-epimerase
LAAYAAEGLSHFIKRFNYNNNLIGSVNLINAAVNTGVKCFVFTSSIAVYGSSPELPMTEETPADPEDPYGIAKLAVEQELRVSKEMFDLDYIVFRPHNVYGERQNIGDKYRNVVGIFMNQILQNKPMTIFGDGSQTRSFCYVSDLIEGIYRLMCSDTVEPVNIGNPQEMSILEFARLIQQITSTQSQIVFQELPVDDPKVRQPDITRAKTVLEWEPSVPVEQGLQQTYQWMKERIEALERREGVSTQ